MSRVTEHLMRTGSGTLTFLPDVPLEVTDQIRKWIEDPDSGAVGAHVVITGAPLDVDVIAPSALYEKALYAGPITDRPTRTSIEFSGMRFWLETAIDAEISRTTGTPAQWVGDLVTNGITAGTDQGGGSNVTRTLDAHSMSHAEGLDVVAAAGGWEYELRPDGSVDHGTIANLFGSTPTIVITDTEEGYDGIYRGVEGGLLDQALTKLGPNLLTKAVSLGPGEGAAIEKGSATTSRNLKTRTGGTPTLVGVFSAPSTPAADLDAVAANFLALQGMRREVEVSTRTPNIRRLLKPGEYVYLHDLATGLFDTSEQIIFRGETITPAKVRCLSASWPIKGYGVYVVQNAASPEVLDVTRWVQPDDGDAFLTVGDWSPPGYGPANRTNPAIEERIAAPATSSEWESFTPSWSNVTTTGATQNFEKRYNNGDLEIIGAFTLGAGSSIDGVATMTLPDGVSGGTPSPVGLAVFVDANGADSFGICLVSGTSLLIYSSAVVAMNTAVPFTWTSGDVFRIDIRIPL